MDLIPRYDSEFFRANVKNRRVLGIQARSVSFRTHEKIPTMHRSLSVQVKDYHGKLITVTDSIMAFLTRLYICQLISPLIDSGRRICQEYDTKTLESMGYLPTQKQITDKKYTAQMYNSDAIKAYLAHLPIIISFQLMEYEKQILYLQHLIDEKEPVVTNLRYLYHADPSLVDATISNYSQDPDLMLSLYLCLDEDILRQMIRFHPYSLEE